jgi:hypothetical protein
VTIHKADGRMVFKSDEREDVSVIILIAYGAIMAERYVEFTPSGFLGAKLVVEEETAASAMATIKNIARSME